jgi:hypothetical protein
MQVTLENGYVPRNTLGSSGEAENLLHAVGQLVWLEQGC